MVGGLSAGTCSGAVEHVAYAADKRHAGSPSRARSHGQIAGVPIGPATAASLQYRLQQARAAHPSSVETSHAWAR